MSITDELREWGYGFCGDTHDVVNAIADRIDAEHKRDLRETGEDIMRNVRCEWVRLPLDADGVPIHVGDVLDGYGKTIEVVELRHGRSGWVLISRDGNGYADTFAFTHHATTVEDVLQEILFKAHIYDKREMELLPDLIAEYASKLQLKEDA